MILKMGSYMYPTKEEWGKIADEMPNVSLFGFPWVPELELLMSKEKTIAEVNKMQNLHEWDYLLNMKIWNLRQSFINAMVNFDRGIALTQQDYKTEKKIINLLQYKLYSEMTFYYLISTRDLILQIINLVLDLSLSENNKESSREYPLLTRSNLINRLKGSGYLQVYNIVKEMEMEEANTIRNSMAHSFSMLDPNRRSTISDDGRKYSGEIGRRVSFENQVKIMYKSLNAISVFIESLRIELKGRALN